MPRTNMIARRAATAALCGTLASSLPAHAQTATPWNDHPNSKVRLIAGEGRMLGVELQMAPGWKTYWRMPGDAGVPPSFDWAGSDNIKSTDVLYPAPTSTKDAAGVAVGYSGTVIFPIKVTPDADGKPVKANLEFAFGVCKDICIPVESKLSLTLDPSKPWPANAALAAHAKRVPTVAADISKAAPLIKSITQDSAGGKPSLRITAPDALDVYVEAPDGLFMPLTTKKPDGFIVDLTATPDLKDLIGKPLRITATTANGGVETTFILK